MADNVVRKAIDKVNTKFSEIGRKEAFVEFLSTYFLCEMAYKKVLSAYHKDNGISDTRTNMKIFYDDIDNVLKFREMYVDAATKDLLFNNKRNNRWNKSARKLRDSIAHNINANDIEEIYVRKEEFSTAMNVFLRMF